MSDEFLRDVEFTATIGAHALGVLGVLPLERGDRWMIAFGLSMALVVISNSLFNRLRARAFWGR